MLIYFYIRLTLRLIWMLIILILLEDFEVEYFVKHEYDGSDRIFAYIRKVDKYEIDNYGQIYFNKFGGF